MASILSPLHVSSNAGMPQTLIKKMPLSLATKGRAFCSACARAQQVALQQDVATTTTTLQSKDDKLDICRVVNGMWQTSGGWGKIDPPFAVDTMLRYVDAGFSTFDMADHYGPAEDLYGIFINRVRRERGEELAFSVKGLTKWVPPPVKMTRAYVEQNIDRSRKRMDVKTLDMLQFHWWEYSDRGYLDALKHLTDLKEEGSSVYLFTEKVNFGRWAYVNTVR